MAKPYYDSAELINFVKQSISFPIYQSTFTEEDILRFANAEMKSEMVPSVMQYHEEYFVYRKDVPFKPNVVTYPIPDRAIGQKFRDLFFVDTNGNELEMVQINSEDRSQFSDAYTSGNAHKFFIENNSVVLLTGKRSNIQGSLRFTYYLRPNQLVDVARAAISSAFIKTITVDNTSISAGDSVSIGSNTFIADTDFAIGVSSIETASNLSAVINTVDKISASNGAVSTNVVSVTYKEADLEFSSSNGSVFAVQTSRTIQVDQVPEHIIDGSLIDFLQTGSGHKIYDFNVELPTGSVSLTSITLPEELIPEGFTVGDYICSQYECIIPMLPDDLHVTLAERTSGRILASIGDLNGLKVVNDKISNLEYKQGTMIDNRAEGAPQKINNTKGLLRMQKRKGSRR
jgi:hypothetical protein